METEMYNENGVTLIRYRTERMPYNHNNKYKYDYRVLDENVIIIDTHIYGIAYSKYIDKVEYYTKPKDNVVIIDTAGLESTKVLIELIEYRLHNINSPTIYDYKILQDIVKLAKDYKLDYVYIQDIKLRFKHLFKI
jgi:hypothetical protein